MKSNRVINIILAILTIVILILLIVLIFRPSQESEEDIIANTIQEPVKSNEVNAWANTEISGEEIARTYFYTYVEDALYNPELAYNALEQEYREKRFGSLQEYQNYIESIREELQEATLHSYMINEETEGITQIVCRDQNENLYIFDQTALLDYTVTLDTYTLPQEKFETEYMAANEQQKVMLNIDKFFQMINAKDYKTAYSVLSEGFKQNNFPTQDSFQQYIESRLYRYNDISYGSFSNEINSIYQGNIQITNRENEEETQNLTIIMQLNEGIDFELAFGVS